MNPRVCLCVCSPRPLLPLSATLTEDQAATIVQAVFRGYLARKQENAMLFRYLLYKYIYSYNIHIIIQYCIASLLYSILWCTVGPGREKYRRRGQL